MERITWAWIDGLIALFCAFTTQINLFNQNLNGYAIVFCMLLLLNRIGDLEDNLQLPHKKNR